MNFYSFSLISFLYLTLAIGATIHILLFKEDIKSSIGWIGLVWLTPVVGSIIYIIFGVNRIRRRAMQLKDTHKSLIELINAEEKEFKESLPSNFFQLLNMGFKIHPQHFALDNVIEVLINGDEAYPQMCEEIQKAKKEVLVESYIFDNDEVGVKFADAFKVAIKNGAKVKVLVDGVGVNYSKPNILKLLRTIKGIETAIFLPSRKPTSLPFVNLRNHRKIMVIDGAVSFFGGMNISKDNVLKNKPKAPVADITFKVIGPVVSQMVRLFLEDWTFARRPSFNPYAFTTNNFSKTDTAARIIPDGPDSDFGKVELMFLGAINCAQKQIKIVTPYFLPEENILVALELAAMRGVDTEIILPSKSNIMLMDAAMRSNFSRLIKRGVRIYQTRPPFDHSKIVVVDGYLSFVGSANWDARSLKLNFESLLQVLNKDLSSKLNKVCEDKKANAIQLKSLKLNLWQKLFSKMCRLLTPYY